ncbi:MAG: YicC family protein [Syntrophales bacterium]|jgi:uncharacterized protein (TIGR00255 family)|nr:YicC family protein [Syntrophales bacterium]MDY0043860.1 YicC/YloC family endoribonuclease [Syntrophales bacterium]
MIKSMTGYGRAESILDGKKIVTEIKSLNHRNLEISIRLPNSFSSLEIPIKKEIAETLSRGRVEVSLRFDADHAPVEGDTLFVNLPLIRSYYKALTEIKKEFGLEDPISLETIANVKNGIFAAEPQPDQEKMWPAIRDMILKAVHAMTMMKIKEGELLYKDFFHRIDLIESHLDSLNSRAPYVLEEYRSRLSDRISELTEGIEIDQLRLSQEIALMSEKSDITEEIVRLGSHMHQVKDLLESSEPVGRKMDFIFQEMHREINTIGSKSSDFEISRNVIEIKTELAKLREQVQNIE